MNQPTVISMKGDLLLLIKELLARNRKIVFFLEWKDQNDGSKPGQATLLNFLFLSN